MPSAPFLGTDWCRLLTAVDRSCVPIVGLSSSPPIPYPEDVSYSLIRPISPIFSVSCVKTRSLPMCVWRLQHAIQPFLHAAIEVSRCTEPQILLPPDTFCLPRRVRQSASHLRSHLLSSPSGRPRDDKMSRHYPPPSPMSVISIIKWIGLSTQMARAPRATLTTIEL